MLVPLMLNNVIVATSRLVYKCTLYANLVRSLMRFLEMNGCN